MAARWKAASRPQNRRTHSRRSTGFHRGPMPPSTRRPSDVRILTAASDSPGRPAELSEAPRSSLLRRRAGTGRPSARGVPSGRREERRRIPLLTAPWLSHAASTSRRRRRTIMPRTSGCSMTQHWRHSTWPIGSGGGRCRCPMWARCRRQRRSRPNSSAGRAERASIGRGVQLRPAFPELAAGAETLPASRRLRQAPGSDRCCPRSSGVCPYATAPVVAIVSPLNGKNCGRPQWLATSC